MEQERPVTRTMAQHAMEVLESALNSGDEEVRVEIWGMTCTMRRSAEGWYAVEAPGESTAARLFSRSPTRPIGYPLQLPFIPNEMPSVTTARVTVLSWLAPEDPGAVFAGAMRQTVEDGWAEDSTERQVMGGGERRAFRKAGAMRHLSLSDEGMVLLVDFLSLIQ